MNSLCADLGLLQSRVDLEVERSVDRGALPVVHAPDGAGGSRNIMVAGLAIGEFVQVAGGVEREQHLLFESS